ncbi:MAG: penicillin-binding transpeptidase domain-containing protein [Candidatus Calescibacterium sp.]|nr:penicillin-binding transpeptidase domain-containing protein [Candidatus Calescibacterium sp.]MCX7972683.1 penicillin-binding transpeptidase domain-containing protein [bacterium]MDW8194720.1 penicillin-binding transpeptidase domain-containing protein [Candidatus Calescibacterium sp.]
MRVVFVIVIVFLAFGWILFNLIKINILSYDIFRARMEYYTTYQVYSNPARANILDRKGYKIAYTEDRINIVLHKSRYNLLSLDEKEFVKGFVFRNFGVSNFEELLKDIYVDRVIVKNDPSYLDICLVMENMMYLYGLDVYIDYRRSYLSGPAFAFVCGFVNIPYREDIEKDESLRYYAYVGKSGLELQYDKELRGELGKNKYLMDPSGHPVKIIEEIPAKRARDLRTTIDKNLQEFAYRELRRLCDDLSRKNMQPVGGSVIVMKVNGEVLSLLSYPSFYPASLEPDCNEVIRDYPDFSCFYNRAISGEYPAASTFKIITSIAALEEGIINPNSRIYCGGVFYVGSHPFYCFNTYGHGSMDVVEALAFSCDVFYYTLGYKLGIKRIKKYSEMLGLNNPTGIDLPFEATGLIPDEEWKMENLSEGWTSGDDVNISIGQGLSLVTPIQMAVVVASVATGYKPVPYINSSKKPILRKIPVDQKNLQVVRRGMEMAIEVGTANVIKTMVRRFKVAGKTGTAEVTPNYNNPKGLNNTWFVGYFGLNNPEFVIVVSLEASGGYGGQYASTLAAKIINYIENQQL